MGDTILKVTGEGVKSSRYNAEGYFYSLHKKENIEEWLDDKGIYNDSEYFEDVFDADEWEEDGYDEDLSVEVSYEEQENKDDMFDDSDCPHDEDIQKFLEGKPERTRLSTLKFLQKRISSNRDAFQNLSKEFKEIIGDKSEDSFDELEQEVSNLLDYKKDLLDEEVPF